MKFRNTLKKVRIRRELNMTELAQRSGLLPSHISNYEKGYRLPSFSTIIALSKALQVTSDELLGLLTDHINSQCELFNNIDNLSSKHREIIEDLVLVMLNQYNEKN